MFTSELKVMHIRKEKKKDTARNTLQHYANLLIHPTFLSQLFEHLVKYTL